MTDSSFIQLEYQACYEQLRYYDTRQEAILKYLFTLTSSVATIQFAALNFFGTPTTEFYAAQSFMSLVVFISSVLLYMMMIQNRLYFVYIAKQINAIRNYWISTQSTGFEDNQLYTSTSFSALKLFSVHTMQLLGAVFISSLFAGATAYGVSHTLEWPFGLKSFALAFFVACIVEIILGIAYLSSKGDKTADDAIGHRLRLF